MLVVSEGKKTEVQYIQGLAQYLRTCGVAVRTAKTKGLGRSPLVVLKDAVRIAKDDPDGFDEVWIVVDVDKHADLAECLRQAGPQSVVPAVSNPCFEVWLLWHYEELTRHETGKELERRLRTLGHRGKSMSSAFPYERYEDALERAIPTIDGPGKVGPNPSSSVAYLVQALLRT